MSLVTTTHELAQACARFARHPFVTVDTEFLRETTFWPKVCVIQIASDDEAIAVDALADGIDLDPFFDLMHNEAVVKVFPEVDNTSFWMLNWAFSALDTTRRIIVKSKLFVTDRI